MLITQCCKTDLRKWYNERQTYILEILQRLKVIRETESRKPAGKKYR